MRNEEAHVVPVTDESNATNRGGQGQEATGRMHLWKLGVGQETWPEKEAEPDG